MNIKKALVEFMEDNGFGTFETDLFIHRAPEDPAVLWWVTGGGGTARSKNDTGEKQKTYVLSVYYRDTDGERLAERLQAFEELVNSPDCLTFPNYDIIEMEATQFAADQDIDVEERMVGLVQVSLTIYQS